MNGSDSGIRSGGAFWWLFQRVSGAFLLLALLVHFWVLHFFPAEGGAITFQTVMARLQHPLWKAFDMLFLVFAIYHGMNGALLLVHDYIKRSGFRLVVIGLLWIVAIYLLILGSITIMGISAGGI